MSGAGCSHPHFYHESFFHAGDEEFLSGAVPFVEQGLAAEETILVAVSAHRIALLREALGGSARAVSFVDMRELGSNPARLIPAWHEFLDGHAGGARGIGEPIWKGRSDPELDECERHEALLNLAFGDGRAWSLMCPYDLDALDDHVIETARRTHPFIGHEGQSRSSGVYATTFDPFAGALPEPPAEPLELTFTIDELAELRGTVAEAALAASLGSARIDDLVLAVNELAINSVCHGGGVGTLLLWAEDDALFCQVSDRGHVTVPLAGRVQPAPEQLSGRGLWLVNHLCDLTQIRSAPGATTVRVSMRLD